MLSAGATVRPLSWIRAVDRVGGGGGAATAGTVRRERATANVDALVTSGALSFTRRTVETRPRAVRCSTRSLTIIGAGAAAFLTNGRPGFPSPVRGVPARPVDGRREAGDGGAKVRPARRVAADGRRPGPGTDRPPTVPIGSVISERIRLEEVKRGIRRDAHGIPGTPSVAPFE
ncbi:hypothetical protein Misp01_60290 [Microtetraspora sp. NBRC 13810]|nr:hypothetical protein Misp01_60290 [Microtetraspora sp. NBRC 13810]